MIRFLGLFAFLSLGINCQTAELFAQEDEAETCYRDIEVDCDLLQDVFCGGGICQVELVEVLPGVVVGIVRCPPQAPAESLIVSKDATVVLSVEASQVTQPPDFLGKEDRVRNGNNPGCGVVAPCVCERPPGWADWNCVPGKFRPHLVPKYEYDGDDCERIVVSLHKNAILQLAKDK